MLKPKKKLTRKKIKEDKLLTSVNKSIDFFNENSKIIISSLIGILVIISISYLYVKSKKSANTAASGRLILAVEMYNAQNYDQAIPALLNISEQFDGTQNAGIASFYLANSYYYKENYTEAKKYFNTYIADYGDDQMFNSTAYAGIASCYAYEGNKAIMNEDYDLVVLDLAMPVGNGLELLEHVREHPDKAELPVIIMTGKLVDDYVLEKAKALNVAAIFTKPYDSDLFIEKVTSLVPVK